MLFQSQELSVDITSLSESCCEFSQETLIPCEITAYFWFPLLNLNSNNTINEMKEQSSPVQM